MHNRKFVIICLVAGLLQACFHDGEPDNQPPPTRPEVVGVTGLMPYSWVDWTANGQLADGFEFGTGNYNPNLPDPYYSIGHYIDEDVERPFSLFIEATGGSYTEPADSAIVSLGAGDAVRASTTFLTDADVRLDVNLSYYTTLAEGLAQYRIAQAELSGFPFNTEEQVINSNNDVSDITGFDILSTLYRDTTDNSLVFSDPLEDETMLGLLFAGISQMTLDWLVAAGQVSRERPYTSIDFINTAYDDIVSDGLLDGLGTGGQQLTIGTKTVDANTYRHDIAVALMRYVDNTRNQTGFTRVQMLPAALEFNDTSNGLFAGVAPIDIDERGAVITNFTPAEGNTVSGDAMFSVDLYCTTGIDQVEFFIDNVHYSFGSGPISRPINLTSTSPFYVPVFQPAGTSGLHTVRVEATCVGGTVTSQTNYYVTFDNL